MVQPAQGLVSIRRVINLHIDKMLKLYGDWGLNANYIVGVDFMRDKGLKKG